MEFHPATTDDGDLFSRSILNTANRLREEGDRDLECALAILDDPDSITDMSGAITKVFDFLNAAAGKVDNLNSLAGISNTLKPSPAGDISEDRN